MEELSDFLDDNLSERPDLSHESSQHWLDAHFPFKESNREDDGFGIELLEKPGVNGCVAARTDQSGE